MMHAQRQPLSIGAYRSRPEWKCFWWQGAVDSEGNPVDVDFYKTFWGLQAYFNNPALALSPASWAKVSAGVLKIGM